MRGVIVYRTTEKSSIAPPLSYPQPGGKPDGTRLLCHPREKSGDLAGR